MRNDVLSVEEMCRRLRPIFGSKIDDLYLKYALMESREQKMEIEQALNALYKKHLTDSLLNDEILLEPPKRGLVEGTYPLGTIMYGEKQFQQFGLREQDWMRHMCVTGMSGSGKTTFAFQILGNFILKNKPFLVFDWKKSFRPLMKLNDKLMIYTVGKDDVANFKLNINEPPKGVNPKEWINLLADLITESYHASFGVHKLITDTLDKAFADFGVYAGSGNYPTWYQIRDRMEERAENMTRKSRESEWLESALRIAYSLTFGHFGETICYKGTQSSNIEELFEKQTIFELASLANTEKKFFCQFTLAYIYKYAKAGNVNTTEEFRFSIIVDEAHNIFLKDRPSFITESIPDVIFREIREYGVSLVTLDQHISKLSDVVAGNSATNIAFQQMLPDDIEAVSRLMQLQDRKNYFSKLPVGTAIVKLVERYNDPFIIKAPLMKLKSVSVSDQELADRLKNMMKNDKRKALFAKRCEEDELKKEVEKLQKINMVSGVETSKKALEDQIRKAAQAAQDRHHQDEKDKDKPYGLTNHVQQKILDQARKRLLNGEDVDQLKRWFINEGYQREEVMKVWRFMKRKGDFAKLATQSQEVRRYELSEEQKNFLEQVQTHPDKPITELYKLTGFSPRKGNDIRKALEENDVIEVYDVRTEKGWTKHVKILYNDYLTSQIHIHNIQHNNTQKTTNT